MISPEMMSNIIAFVTGSGITILAFLTLLMMNPDKIDKWTSNIYRLGAFFSKRSELRYMATNIQNTIDDKIKKLGADNSVISYGLEINWTKEESAEVDLIENRVIVMMMPFKSQQKNLARIISLYVPKALLPESRRYVDPNLMKGIDYTISKNILEDNPPAFAYYIEDEADKITEDVKQMLELIEPLNSNGRLSRVIITEYKSLSGLHPSEPSEKILKETVDFIKQMSNFETAESGYDGEESSGIFLGENIKMAMVPVGDPDKLVTYGTVKHLEFVEKQLKQGVEHFYIVSAGRVHPIAKEFTKRVCRELGLSLVYEELYDGIFRGRKMKMYCACCTRGKIS